MRFHSFLGLLATSLFLLPADGKTVHGIPELLCELGHASSNPSRPAFEFTCQVIFPCTAQDTSFVVTDGTNNMVLVSRDYWPDASFEANDIVHVKGEIGATGNPDCATVKTLGKAPPIPPSETTIPEILRAKDNRKLVHFTGVVRSALCDEVDPKWAEITLCDRGEAIQAYFAASSTDLDRMHRLVNAKVSVVGITQTSPFPLDAAQQKPGFNFSRRYLPVSLSLRSLSNLRILTPAPADPFDVPELNHSNIPLTGSCFSERRSVVGQVLARYGHDKILLKDDAGEIINVTLAGQDRPLPGMRVRLAGYPTTDVFHINMNDALWHPEDGTPNPDEVPTAIAIADLMTDGKGHVMFKPSYHGRAIRIRGTVRIVSVVGNQTGTMIIEDNGLAVTCEANQCPQVLASVSIGSEVEATGICIMPTDNGNWQPNKPLPRIREVRMALRTPADLTVLRTSPWWTPQRFLTVVLILFLCLVTFFFWNRLLKRKVELRSRELLNEQIARVTADLKTLERTRLSIELHDSFAQALTGVALQLQTAREILHSDATKAESHVQTAYISLQSCREELRNCLRDLRCDTLGSLDMNEAIRKTLLPHLGDVSASIRFHIPRERLTDNTTHAILRIIRELTVNAIRHGKANRVKIAGAIEAAKLYFSVSDNGCGFTPGTQPGPLDGHFGLQGIRERVNSFNGTFEIKSSPGDGTKATITLSIPHEDSSCNG